MVQPTSKRLVTEARLPALVADLDLGGSGGGGYPPVKIIGTTWPVRPTSNPAVTIMWVGGTESNTPPGVAGDLWFRNMSS